MGPGDPDLDLDESVHLLSLYDDDVNLFEQNDLRVNCSWACPVIFRQNYKNLYASFKNSNTNITSWLADSGASFHFTEHLSDFHYYRRLKHCHQVQTAAKGTRLEIVGVGSVLLEYRNPGDSKACMVLIKPVFHIPGMNSRLLSIGQFLRDGYMIQGNLNHMTISKIGSEIKFTPIVP